MLNHITHVVPSPDHLFLFVLMYRLIPSTCLKKTAGTVELSADAATAEAAPAAAPAEEAAPASTDAGQVPDDAPYYGDAPDHEIALDVVAWHCNVGRVHCQLAERKATARRIISCPSPGFTRREHVISCAIVMRPF